MDLIEKYLKREIKDNEDKLKILVNAFKSEYKFQDDNILRYPEIVENIKKLVKENEDLRLVHKSLLHIYK